MHRLNREDLFDAPIEAVVRLARYLEIHPERLRGESEKSYRSRCVAAIQKWEKHKSREPKPK